MALRVRRLAAALAGLVLVLAVGAVPAGAHGGGADFTALEATEVAPGRVEVRVAVAHEGDGHPAEGALVEVAAAGPDGATAGPVEAERQDEPGVYLAALDVAAAGAWTVSVVSSFPPGEVELPVDVALAAPGGDATTSTTPTTSAPGTATEPSVPEVDEDPPGRVESDDTVNWVVAGIFGLLGGALGLWVSNRRSARRRSAASDHAG